MKQKVLSLIVIALLFTACAPLTPPPTPTATALPSRTPPATTTLTPTATPTATPTPIPTLPPQQVGGLSDIPDPHAAAPKFFDLFNSESPIPQFTNAMRMAGIEVNLQEVADNLQYQPITGADGKQYVVAYYNFDPDPNQQGETLEGKIPLMIWSEEGGWREATPSNLGIMRGILVGTMSHPPGTGEVTYRFHEAKKGRFNTVITITDYWTARERLEGSPNMTYIDKEIEEALNLGARTIRIAHLISHQQTPSWLEEKSGAKFKTAVLNHIEQHMSYITDRTIRQAKAKGLSQITLQFNVFNEIWHGSMLAKRWGGRDALALETMKKAIEVRNQLLEQYKNSGIDVTIELGISHACSHYLEGEGSIQLAEILSMLEGNSIYVDYVDLHGHEKDFNDLPSIASIEESIKRFQKFNNPHGAPVKVVVGEYDLNIMRLANDPQRFMKQAERYFQVIDVLVKNGVKEITFWGVVDSESWYEHFGESEKEYNSPIADALLIDDNGNLKPSYFAVMMALYLNLW